MKSSIRLCCFAVLILYFCSCGIFKPVERPCLLFVGDSIVKGWDVDWFFPEYRTVNAGVGGDFIGGVISRVGTETVKNSPEYIIVLVGTNDTRAWINSIVTEEWLVDTVETQFSELIAVLELLNRKYVIISLLPYNKKWDEISYQQLNSINIKINSSIKACLEKTDKGYFYDCYTLLSKDDGELLEYYTTDGLHLTNMAYNVMSKNLYSILYCDE